MTRYFEVKVTGCRTCVYASTKIDICKLASLFKWGVVYQQNKDQLTDSCPMWEQTKESETK